MAYRLLIRMEIHAGRAAEFEQAWLAMSDIARAHPASRGQWLARARDEEDVYYIVTDWADEAGFQDFADSPGHARGGATLRELRRGGSRTPMTVVHQVEPHGVGR